METDVREIPLELAPVAALEKARRDTGTIDVGPAAGVRGYVGGSLAGTHLDLEKAHERRKSSGARQ